MERLGYRPARSGVIVDRESAAGPNLSPVPSVNEPAAGVPYQLRSAELRMVLGASQTQLRRCIPRLPEKDRALAGMLFLERRTIPELAESSRRPVESLTVQRHEIAGSLAALLLRGVLLPGAAAAAVIRQIHQHAPDALRPYRSEISETMRDRFERFFIGGQSTAVTAAAEGGSQNTVDKWVHTLAREWVAKLPRDLVRDPAGVGEKWREIPWDRLRAGAYRHIAGEVRSKQRRGS